MSTLLDPTFTGRPSAVQLRAFNELDRRTAADLLRTCLDFDRWIDAVLDERPWPHLDALLQTVRQAGQPYAPADLDQICARCTADHPAQYLITESSAGTQAAGWLESDAAGTGSGQPSVVSQLLTYRQRFGRPFVVRTAGRSQAEVIAKLDQRLRSDPATEYRAVAAELRDIAALRLVHLIVG
jgi:2-oxo-4-hydroxy-4-carboxy-5-ureidoimidazoline decarboxylase